MDTPKARQDDEPTEANKRLSDSSSKAATKTVEIKISLPNVPDLTPITGHPAYSAAKLQTAKIRSNKYILSGIIAVVVAFIASSYLLPDSRNVTADKSDSPQGLTRGTPKYDTLLPVDKTIQELGGWTRVSPTDREPVYAYVDAINGTKIIVSQQPLPEDFKPNTVEKIETLAKDYNATQKITVDGQTVYIGTSEKGPQSLILSRDNLLIFIKSSVKIDGNEWAKYINSLQ